MTAELVAAVRKAALEAGVSGQTLAALRAQFPGIHFSLCGDDDVVEARPFLSGPELNIYLVDGREHCLTLTEDLNVATGLLLAEVSDRQE